MIDAGRRSTMSGFCTLLSIATVLALPAVSGAQTSTTPSGPVAGQSINMVSGKTLPGGDPYLQRQNEPSLAVSSRNARHLMAGANDYRTVDIPGLPDGTETGDSWLGLFKSFDGGETWQSTLLPGYPQDTTPEGQASPLKGYAAGADPIVRAGTHGLFYYGGIAFNRTTNLGVLHVSTFLDLNNKENGDVTAARDPIRFAGTAVVDTGTAGQFLDKPWLGVDVPRAGAVSRTITLGGTTQTIPCGNVYMAWAKFTGSQSTKIMVSRSRDCGVTWENPTKLSESNSVNQGTVVAIGPDGAVYVAWRRFRTSSDTDAILFAKSTDFGKTFTKASAIAPAAGRTFLPFDQASNPAQSPYLTAFRTNTYPSLAVANGRVYAAWTQRPAAGGFARVVLASSADGGSTWSAPALVDDGPLVDETTGLPLTDGTGTLQFDRGHQFMPALAASGGRLMILYYDTRLDHTVGKYEEPAGGFQGRYDETREPVGQADLDADAVFTPTVDDATLTQRRHTIDVRVGQLNLCAASPAIRSARASRAPFGVADLLGRDIQQLKFNPPNLPLFGKGRIPFVGDYIDIAGTDFVAGNDGSWSFNTACAAPPAFQATWTSNEDVKAPANGDWTAYTPVGKPGCDPDRVGMRNQNVYSGRITEGLLVSSPQTAKPLKPFVTNDPASVRAFVVLVQNLTDQQRSFRLSIPGQPAGGTASFKKWDLGGPVVTTLDVDIAPRSGISRPVFATSTDPSAAIRVEVTETTGGGLSGFVVLNADRTNATLADPDGGPAGVNTVEIYTPSVSNPSVYNPSVTNPSVSNPSVSNPSVTNPSVYNPSVSNPSVYNPSVSNPSVYNTTVANPSVTNPSVYNGALVNTAISDASYAVTNVGNTSTSYRVQLVGDSSTAQQGLQLLVTKNQTSPAANGCTLVETAQSTVLVNVANPLISSPATAVFDPALEEGSVKNTTFSLRPGETGYVTLRGQYDLSQMATIAASVVPVLVPHPTDPKNAEYAAPLAITRDGSALPAGTFGVPYGPFDLGVFGGKTPYSCSVDGAPGLEATGCTISGTPTQAGPFTPTIVVSDSSSPMGTVTRSFTLSIAKATPALTWATPQPIAYGTALSATQLNATASVPGTFAYAPAAGTVLGAGTQTLSVTFTPTDGGNYGSASATVTLLVNRATPTITWADPAAITYGTALSATQLNATASVPGTFAYAPAAGAVLGAGAQTLSVAFTPVDTTNYGSATATVSLTVAKASTTTTLASSVNPSTFSEAVTFTATVAGPAGTPAPTGVVTFRDGAATLGTTALAGGTAAVTTSTLAVGSHSITAQYTPDAAAATNLVGGTSNTITQTVGATYAFTGFLTPLQPAGTLAAPSNSGTQSFGSAVPVKWQLKDSSGNFVGDLATATWLRAYPNTSKGCTGAPNVSGGYTLLYSPTSGAKGNSTFRFGSNQYNFNWDTASTTAKGCYTLALQLSDGSPVKATNVLLK